MKIILVFITSFLLLQTDIGKIQNLNQVDFSDDGKLMVGINEEAIYLIDTERLKVVDKYTFSGNYGVNPNVRISGNGEHLICARGHKFYYAKIRKNKIKAPIELINRVWLDMEINYDGTEFIAALDRKSSLRKCSPGKRQIVKFWRDNNSFEWDTLLPNMEDCHFASYGELLPDGGIIYHLKDGNIDYPHPTILEAVPDGKYDWGHVELYNQGDWLTHQPMTEKGSFLTYALEKDSGYCGLYLTEKDENGYWQKSPNILPRDKDCQGPWFSCISPDGTKIAWLKLTRDERGQPIKGDIMITYRLDNDQWSTPIILIENFGVPSEGKQIKSMRISNDNIAFTLWKGITYLYTSLDKNGTLFKLG